jgi:CheY-like chemotaxis protein/two-component sensor histidine kinase
MSSEHPQRLVAELEAEVEELRAELQRKDDLLATLGHEFRNPLGPIRAAVELWRHHGAALTDEQRQRTVEVVGRQADHLAHLVDDLLDVSRVNPGRIRLRRGALDLREILEQSHDAVRGKAQLHRLTISLPTEPIPVQGDAVRLRQVFVNLLDNAVKFTQRGRGITVRVTAGSEQAVVTVTDEGVGIDPARLHGIFGPPARPEDADQPHGLGLGLAWVRQLVELHRGSVSVRSGGIGRGSEFTVSLPLAGNSAPALHDREAPAAPIHLLLVDDNVDGARMLGHLLEVHGYRISLAFDGAGAIEAFARLRPDAVLLDPGLPDIDGLEVARHMRLQWPGVHLIAVTGHGDEHVRSLVRETGFAAHVLKPVEIDALRRTLDKVGATRR